MTFPSRGWMWVSLILILLVGVSLGVIGDHLVYGGSDRPRRSNYTRPVWFSCADKEKDLETHPDYPYGTRSRSYLINRLSEDLSLRPEQQASIEALLDSKREEVVGFWVKTRGRYCRFQQELRVDIRDLLDPDQQEIYDAIVAQVEASAARRAKERRERRHK